MLRQVTDNTGRFKQRPHYQPQDIDRSAEKLINDFLKSLYGQVSFPIKTDDLTKLIEKSVEELDQYADLSSYGPNVEGVTEFFKGKKPIVKISVDLTEQGFRENRLRTTLAHEYGHVHLHRYLFELEGNQGELYRSSSADANKVICKRDAIVEAKPTDWMEWQANYFSSAILMPISKIKKIVEQFRQQGHLQEFIIDNSDSALGLITAVKESFQVSSEAARIRLLQLKFIQGQSRN